MADDLPDIEAARAAGYSDKEILAAVGPVMGADVGAAVKAGYSASEVLNALMPPPPPKERTIAAAAPAPEAPQPVSGMALGMAKAAGQTVLETVPKLEVGVGAMMKSAGQGEAVQSRRDIDLMHRLDQGEEFGTLMKSAPNDLARLALAQYRRATPEEKTALRQDAINTAAAPPNALERGGTNVLAAGQHGSEEAKKLIPLTPEEEGRTSVVVAKTAASLLTFLATAGPAGIPGMVAYGGVESYGKTYEEAKKAGASDEDATVAAAISGVVQGGLNAVPAHKALAVADQIPKAFKGEFIKTLTEMAKSGGTLLGFTQVSQLADNYIAKETFEPGRDLKRGLGENMGATFGVGALLPVVPAVAARAFRPRTPAEVAKPVLEAKTTDEAIAAAQNTVAEGTPVDISETIRNAEYGTTTEQNQARLLSLFGGLNKGAVEQAGDAYHYRTEVDGQEQTIPLKVWDPAKPLAEGEQQTATISPDLAEAQRKHYDSLGVKVVYFENDARIPFDGAVDPAQPDTIFLSNDPSRNAAQIGAHEVTHVLESTTLPDGTNLGDLLHDQVRKGLTPEGQAYAEKLFGSTAPKREAFGQGVEGDSAHADAVVKHLITELGADIGAEAPKFQTFAPRVVEAIEQRYGVDAAKGVLAKLISGFKNALDTMRNFFSRADEHPEYGQTPTVSQHWVTNLADIHDTLAKMYAERFGTQAEKGNASLTAMREKVQRDRFLANFERPASEIAPPSALEGFASQRPVEEPARAPAEAAIPPEAPVTPEPPRPPGPMNDPAAYAEAASRASVLRRWLSDLDAERRSAAPASPQATLLKQTEAAIIAKVNGIEARLTGAQAERLAAVRAQIEELHNPTTPSADMVKVRQALEAEQQKMADAASIGSPAAPIREAGNSQEGRKLDDGLPKTERIQAVMPERRIVSDIPATVPERDNVPRETAPVAERPQPTPDAPPRAVTAPIAEPPVSAFQAKVRAERERLWAEEMPGYKREGGTTRQGLASASAANERMVTESARDKVMREEIGEDAVMDAIERGLTDDQIFAVARFYRPEEGKTPQQSFREAVDRYAALEHEQALREEAAGLFDPDYDALKVSNPDLAGMERAYRLMEEANARERAASEAPFESGEADGNGRAPASEVPERQDGAEEGGQPGGRGKVPGEEQGGDALKFSPRQTETPEFKRWFGDSKVVDEEGKPSVVYHGTNQNIDAFSVAKLGSHTNTVSAKGFFFSDSPAEAGEYAAMSARRQVSNADEMAANSERLLKEIARAERRKDWDLQERLTLELEENEHEAMTGEERGANILPTYLAIKNPMIVDMNGRVDLPAIEKAIADAKRNGNDGLRLDNVFDPVAERPDQSTTTQWVAFNPEQIKSAIGNSGAFDPANPDIRMSPRIRTPEQIEADKAFATDKTVMEKIRDKLENLPENAVIQTLDRFYGVKADDPLGYMGLRLSNNAAGATEAFMTASTLRFDGRTYNWKERTGGVEALVKGLGVEAMDFAKWIAGHRAEILKGEGRENLLNDTQIRGLKSLNQGTLSEPYTLANGKTTMSREAAYLDALKKYHDLNKNVMDLAVEGGLITRKVADDLLKNPFYIPFYRVDPREGEQFVAPNSSSASVKQTAFKKLKGGTEQLNDLWENATSNWAHLIEAALKNKNTAPVLETAVKQGAATKLTTQEAMHLSDKEQKANTVWVMVDGEKQYYRIEDKGLFAAVSVLEPVINIPVISPLARGAKSLLQTGITMNPAFAIRNVIRDTQQVIATTPISWNVANNLYTGFKENNAARAIENLARATVGRLFGAELKDAGMSDTALSALASGALMRFGDVADAGVRQTKVKNLIDTPEAFDSFWQGVKAAGGAYRKVMAQSEDVSRIALFKQLKDQGLPTDFAAFSAKDIADFSLTGAAQLVRTLNSMSAFTNARMQGLYKVVRSTADADGNVPLAIGTRVGLGIAKRVATVVLAGMLVDLGLDALYANDEDWKKRDELDKNSNYWFKIGKTEFRIPKGFEVGAVSRLGAIFVESFYDKEMTAGRVLKNVYSILADNLNLNPTPTILKPALDIYGNSNAASGNPIVPRGLERLQPEQRYTINNTLQSRGLSAGMNTAMRAAGMKTDGLSPIQIDYLARAYGGWLATTSMQMGDTVARSFTSEPVKPADDRLAYYTGGIVSSEPRSASRYINMLYEQGDGIEKAYATYRDMLAQGHADEAQKFFAANKDELQKHGLVSGVMRLESNINKQIRMITNNPDPRVTPEQKRIQIMQLNAVKNRAAEQVFGAH